ncbi:hypothetical protein A2693_03830 [Candidatus Curtissbacteria bacterium RIFCSPHIGHO2_01_FULL_40_12]|uniref:Carbohydrate kinase PfkB domain-containing protein n=1 Tax=Candidatus Curtissbacteria bacterium RIFCSPHIGHO2_01_FULL_40_12 TaxID=1797710 RepID=A0A1F5GBU7_9BACT|nr:MAG: hypothetical protein A2693_03830 [Candidatus Curtissbacteria bacterium RIFCSPHIGHO2_01_FULL_40_12]
MRVSKVIGFGALNVDNIFKVNNLSLAENPAHPVDVQAGGNAANTITALAKLGVGCGFVGVVASDAYGKLIISEFKRRNIDISRIIFRKSADSLISSGLVETYVDKRGRRMLFVKPGVNGTLSINEINSDYFNKASVVHFTSFVDDQQFHIQKMLIKKIPDKVTVSFAPGSLYAERGLKALEPFIERTDILFLARRETYYLTGMSFKKAVEKLLTMGPRIVIVTFGDKGSFIATKGEQFIVKARKVKVVDTTGAGDAYAAGFLYGIVNNFPIKRCAEIASALASFSVQKLGARAGLPNRKELSAVVSLAK